VSFTKSASNKCSCQFPFVTRSLVTPAPCRTAHTPLGVVWVLTHGAGRRCDDSGTNSCVLMLLELQPRDSICRAPSRV